MKIQTILFGLLLTFGINSTLFAQFDDDKSPIIHQEKSSDDFLTQKRIPWSQDELKDVDKFAAEMKLGGTNDILILNIGSVDDIKDAIHIGPVALEENQKKLANYLTQISKDKAIMIYCGCCPTDVCPNVKKAYHSLKTLGYTNFEILNLKANLDDDWTSKGYPMASKK